MGAYAAERPLAIWVAGEPVAEAARLRGSFADMIRSAVGEAWPGAWSAADITTNSFVSPEPAQLAGVIVTGSPARIADQAPWMVRVQQALRELVAERVPVLGICFGHQLLGMALGGSCGPNPLGREIGSVRLRSYSRSSSRSLDDPLFSAAPQSFLVSMTHLDAVLELPPGAAVLGATDLDRHAAVRFGEHAWGVQFHPEMGAEIIGAYIDARRDALRSEGLDPQRLLADCADTPEATELLRGFARRLRRARTPRAALSAHRI
ncbi:MAG TPA: glutamine amidotransferase [Gammaproteobacteria bacterium]|nr:glutamine amidotransferase [Gammaproteobacteria bacterium]